MITYLLFIVFFILSITIHEYSHGLVADQLGDPTPRLSKRLTLNPIPHIDLFGTIILPFILQFPIGWAKPMPIDPFNLKNPQKDTALIAVAGPTANLLLALVLSMLLRLLNLFDISFLNTIGILIIPTIIKLNIILAVFNLFPIHPLDGFNFISGFLSEDKYREWMSLRKYGLLFIVILVIPLFSGTNMLSFILNPITNFLIKLLLPGAGIGEGII